MAGEQNGTTVIIQKGSPGADIVGQGEFTVTYGGEPITFENKSAGDWVLRLDGELSGRELVLAGTLTYNSDTVYRDVKADALEQSISKPTQPSDMYVLFSSAINLLPMINSLLSLPS